ncbi:hypothetical protein GMSM_36950 [Geomonas sp. Red276]
MNGFTVKRDDTLDRLAMMSRFVPQRDLPGCGFIKGGPVAAYGKSSSAASSTTDESIQEASRP